MEMKCQYYLALNRSMHAPRHHNLISDLIDSKLSIGDQIQFMVVSNSMAPLIRAGDSVIADITQPDSIRRGDIVVIRREEDFLTHRAIIPNKGNWFTKGDNAILFDPPSNTNNVIGRVVAINKGNQSITFQTRKWTFINPILAKLGELEAEAFALHPLLRFPFRFGIKIIQKLFF